MDLELGSRIAVITGGSKGIGYATAYLLAREGATVVIAARRASALEEAASDIKRETGVAIDTFAMDVAETKDLDRFTNWLKERHGSADILINNAGTGTYKPFLKVTDEELLYGMAINFFAQFRLSQRLVPMMMAAGGGAIINVAGRTAYQTANPPGSTCTGPAKAAELRFTADLADELRPHGIRVNCVVPGVVVTEERFEKWEREAAANNYDPDAALARREVIVSADGPWGDAWEIADTIVYLASNRARYVNGASLLVDGANKNSYTRLLRERP